MMERWHKQLRENSGNLTSNAPMPEKLIDSLLEEDLSAKEKIKFQEITFPTLNGVLGEIEGMDILAGLQSNRDDASLTLFRAIRFPTYKRLLNILQNGFTVSNFEQERILDLYLEQNYLEKRKSYQTDELFWIQPQERVVDGIPVFMLVNDAIQIHSAYRGTTDKVAVIALHIPRRHLENRKINLIANSAIDLDYNNSDRDVPIHNFRVKDGVFEIDYPAMRARGVDLHEMYTKDLPLTMKSCNELGIKQDFYLLDVYEISDFEPFNNLVKDSETLLGVRSFLHGFFGDQNIFGRRRSKYLPEKCYRLETSE